MSKIADHGRPLSEVSDHSSPDDSIPDDSPIMVVVLEHGQCWIGETINYEVGLTLLAIMSEDPACWQDVAKHWPRYRTSSVCQELPVEQWTGCDEATAWKAIAGHGNWLLLDLQDKRVVTGAENQDFDHDMTLVLRIETQQVATVQSGSQQSGAKIKQHDLLPIHLPPWWELHQKIGAAEVSRRRAESFKVPYADRDVLYGRPLLEDLASRIIEIALTGRTPDHKTLFRGDDGDSSATGSPADRAALQAWYELTTEVHREWLMTARDDLAGGRPRDLLHGAHDWSDAVTEGQMRRFNDQAPLVAGPVDVEGYAQAPLGSQEMIVYFDLCRELIQAGWHWIAAQKELKRDDRGKLTAFLQEIRDEWLELPFEGGASPGFIIECSRRRVPRASGVAIEGMDECEPAAHPGDCDCPICNMLDAGMFGTSCTSLDGHHLELDDEFAFSMFEKFEDWEEQSGEWREISEACEEWEPTAKSGVDSANDNSDGSQRPDELQPDEFASAWSGLMSDGPLPGDRRGYLKLAFRLAEIIGDLESVSAPRPHIVSLNQAFRAYFESDSSSRGSTQAAFKQTLEQIAGFYPYLLPKVCDLQSQIDELERRVSRC